jgi:hypothetical protein
MDNNLPFRRLEPAQHPLQSVMGNVFTDVQRRLEIRIAPEIRRFIVALVAESIRSRADEWEQRGIAVARLDKQFAAYMTSVLVDRLLTDLDPEDLTRTPHQRVPSLSLIAFLFRIHIKWCGIFPFCR